MNQYRLLIAGEDVPAASGATFEALNPTSGETWATHALGGADDVDRAVRAAQSAFESEAWREAIWELRRQFADEPPPREQHVERFWGPVMT